MELLVMLLVVLVVTRAAGEIAVRLGQPALVGELLSGIALGAVIRHLAALPPVEEYYAAPSQPALLHLASDPVFLALTDLGVFFLMLQGGVELRGRDIVRSSARSLQVAVGGMLLPLALGFAVAWPLLPDSELKLAQVLFVATTLAITAVPVTIRALMDLGKLDSAAGRVIVSAAIVDDVLSLLLLAVLTALIERGTLPTSLELAWLAGGVGVFLATASIAGRFLLPLVSRAVRRLQTAELEFTALVVFALGLSVWADMLGLHFILGAFLAGLYFERGTGGRRFYEDVRARMGGVTTGFLAPIFFASIGLRLDLAALWEIPGFVALLVTCAFVGKLVGGGLPAYWSGLSRRDSLAVGVGMSGRGAVELIVADIALRAGLFEAPTPVPPLVGSLFSATVLMAILTTVAVPLLLRRIFAAVPGEAGE